MYTVEKTLIEINISGGPLLYKGIPATQIIMRDIMARKRREREFEALFAVGEVLRVSYKRDEMISVLMDTIPSHLAAEEIGLIVLYPDSGTTSLENAFGSWTDLIGQHAPFGKEIIEKVLDTGTYYFTNNINDDP